MTTKAESRRRALPGCGAIVKATPRRARHKYRCTTHRMAVDQTRRKEGRKQTRSGRADGAPIPVVSSAVWEVAKISRARPAGKAGLADCRVIWVRSALSIVALAKPRSTRILIAPVTRAAGCGPQPAFILEFFSIKLRYSGASIWYQLAGVIGGMAVVGSIALVEAFHTAFAVSSYVLDWVLILVARRLAPSTRHTDLDDGSPDTECTTPRTLTLAASGLTAAARCRTADEGAWRTR